MFSHLHNCFKSEKQSFGDLFAKHKRTFGTLLVSDYILPNEYTLSLKQLKANLLNEDENTIFVPMPASDLMLRNLVEMALSSTPPFSNAKKGKKDFTDAGFKDAILLETMLGYAINEGDIKILFTDDRDYDSVAIFQNQANNHSIIHTFNDLIKFVKEKVHIQNEDIIEAKFMNDEYLISQLMQQIELSVSNPVISINGVREASGECMDDTVLDENVYEISMQVEEYNVIALYDFNANEIINTTKEGS
jgi:hypothetical protein